MKYLVLSNFDAGAGPKFPGQYYSGPHAEELLAQGCLKVVDSVEGESFDCQTPNAEVPASTPTPEPVKKKRGRPFKVKA